MKVYCLRIGNKYGPEYEKYINKKLKKYDVVWIREPYDKRIALQWNKMQCMALKDKEPIVVLDIDVILTGNYKKLFDYPIKRGEFLSIPAWWGAHKEWKMNGGFQKYYPQDCKYIYDIFTREGVFIARTNLKNIALESESWEEILPVTAKNNRLYCLQQKDNGYKVLVIYRMKWT